MQKSYASEGLNRLSPSFFLEWNEALSICKRLYDILVQLRTESLDENTVHVHRLVHELITCKSHKCLNFDNQSSETSLIVHRLVQVYVFLMHHQSAPQLSTICRQLRTACYQGGIELLRWNKVTKSNKRNRPAATGRHQVWRL